MKVSEFSFRNEQIDALRESQNYLKKFKEGNTKKSMLVCMPTGSGKSGVIAFLSREFVEKEKKAVLVLTPRTKITEQLFDEVEGNFFKKLNKSIPVDKLPGECVLIKKSIDALDGNLNNKIIFLNIQKLMKIWMPPTRSTSEDKRKRDVLWNKLMNNVGLVIVDEGHYEPAKSWSECIRSFKEASKIIFTATPYRNDLKEFDVDSEHRFICTYNKSHSNGSLRTIEFLPPCNRMNYNDFINHVIREYEKLLKSKQIEKDAKVIIRCDNFDSIQKMADLLDEKKIEFYAIHEGFNQPTLNRVRKVPKKIVQDQTVFWIHQYKLMEGVDDPSFQLLCNFDNFSNARSLIQQIGRIIRKRKKSPEVGYVIENFGGRENTIWNTYLDYDKHIESYPEDIFFETSTFLSDLETIHPSFSYVENNFRKKFVLTKISPELDLLLPLSCNVFKLNESINLEKLVENIKVDLQEKDRAAQEYSRENYFIVLHSGVENSKFLSNHTFLENSLDVIFVFILNGYVAIIDSTGFVDKYVGNQYSRIDPKNLQRLYKSSKDTIISSISLVNTNLGPNSIRNKSFNARKISETAISVDDYSQFCSTSLGYSFEVNPLVDDFNERHVRRYVGYSSCKITQDLKYQYSISQFEFWLSLIIEKLNSGSPKLKLFKRYSKGFQPSVLSKAENILLFLYDLETYFNYRKGVAVYEDVCADLDKDYNFEVKISKITYKCKLLENPVSKTFKIISPDLDKDFDSINSEFKNFTSFLNKGQIFSILFKDEDYVYSSGRFYQPEIKVGPSFQANQFRILDYIEGHAVLNNIKSEKGTATEALNTKWETGSLFRLIADLGVNSSLKRLFGNPDYLVCDDMGSEVADFILVDKKRVIFIHGKAGDGVSKVSASSLQEVCGQATKNISYLSPFNKIKPSGFNTKWKKEWSARGVAGTVKNRFVKGSNNPQVFWNTVEERLRDPGTVKEVWLLLGNILSKNELELKLKSSGDYRVALQASLLILSSYQAAYSIGARLRIICSP